MNAPEIDAVCGARVIAGFARARAGNRAALMPYWPLGYPDRATSLAVVEALAEAGADLIELGVPFSDPLADGPVIQHATHVALARGTRAADSPAMLAELRRRGVSVPLLLMGYANPLLAYGAARYAADVRAAGGAGLIVPDLPPDDAAEVADPCAAQGLALPFLLAPTSTPARIALAARRSTGFVYLVSVTGVTGARASVPPGLPEFVARVRAAGGALPLAVGFGVSTPEQTGAIGRVADGVIVGSALIDAAGEAPDPPRAAGDFVRALRAALVR
jgi:tryptophan synthase alpha chain